MLNKTIALKNFLMKKTYPDLAALYDLNIEVQVNAAKDHGEKITGTTQEGHNYTAFSDGLETWKTFRIPYKADTDPEYTDHQLRWNLETHCEGIGLTGWNWGEKISKWIGFDFDSIYNHVDGLTNDDLQKVKDTALQLNYITARKSTSGSGLHFYIFLDDIPTQTHTEHAALARAILGKMCADTGYDFTTKIDCCGGVMWIWHRKMEGTDGLKLIKQGEKLYDIPTNWKDHIHVVTGKRRRVGLDFHSSKREETDFDRLMNESSRVPLDEDHQLLLSKLDEIGAQAWWSQDHYMLIAHTYDLKRIHGEVSFRGIFETDSKTSSEGTDHNCFLFPMPNGGWVVRRYNKGIKETATWTQDNSGWTRCYYNIEANISTAALAFGATETEGGEFQFREALIAQDAAKLLNETIVIPMAGRDRPTTLKKHKDGRLIIRVEKKHDDDRWDGWSTDKKGNFWQKIYNIPREPMIQISSENYDDTVRHLVSPNKENNGWVIMANGSWVTEPLAHIKSAMASYGIEPRKVEKILGRAILQPFVLENIPFDEEYLGNRRWNRNAAQLRYSVIKSEDCFHPTWDAILEHCGNSLDIAVGKDSWCIDNEIRNGYDYLKAWCASMFQQPNEPLPYLFFYGPENSGKTTFHEALRMLMVGAGYARADNALTNDQGFNAEIEHAVLCVVEEINIREHKVATARIKDWVTASELSIHKKQQTPYLTMNCTHWVQTSNNQDYCPISFGDTRIVMVFVDNLKKDQEIPKRTLIHRLKKEAEDFTTTLMRYVLPEIGDRLAIRVVDTQDKVEMGRSQQSIVAEFLREHCNTAPGYVVSIDELYDSFQKAYEARNYTKRTFLREIPAHQYPKGRVRSGLGKAGTWHIGNISLEEQEEERSLLVINADTHYLEPLR